MQAYKKGDYAAFEELYRRHAAKVYGFIKKRLADSAEADEVFQAAFLKLHQSRGRYNDGLPFTPWFFSVTRNILIDYLRRRARRREQTVDPRNAVLEREAPAAVARSESQAAAILTSDKLSARDRAVLTMHYVEGLPFEQIAVRLGISHSSGRQIASRAIRKLKAILGARSART